MLSAGTYTISFHGQVYQVIVGYIFSANIQYTWWFIHRTTGEGRIGATNAHWRVSHKCRAIAQSLQHRSSKCGQELGVNVENSTKAPPICAREHQTNYTAQLGRIWFGELQGTWLVFLFKFIADMCAEDRQVWGVGSNGQWDLVVKFDHYSQTTMTQKWLRNGNIYIVTDV